MVILNNLLHILINVATWNNNFQRRVYKYWSNWPAHSHPPLLSAAILKWKRNGKVLIRGVWTSITIPPPTGLLLTWEAEREAVIHFGMCSTGLEKSLVPYPTTVTAGVIQFHKWNSRFLMKVGGSVVRMYWKCQ